MTLISGCFFIKEGMNDEHTQHLERGINDACWEITNITNIARANSTG